MAFLKKHALTHSPAMSGSCFSKLEKSTGLTRVPSAWILTPEQLFCYFPCQHLVLISFLVRLRLRPIRADYQRGVWNRVQAHYDSCPRGEAKMKDRNALHEHTRSHKPAKLSSVYLSSAQFILSLIVPPK